MGRTDASRSVGREVVNFTLSAVSPLLFRLRHVTSHKKFKNPLPNKDRWLIDVLIPGVYSLSYSMTLGMANHLLRTKREPL